MDAFLICNRKDRVRLDSGCFPDFSVKPKKRCDFSHTILL
ncbi:hypothetical protein LEP1GSC062_0119 [Leptospira alexanderi serovar Manhao 3 str. L 60]|uniref:Uncharacterized protein n=1 Tax=Leptospira alexanderi serovar Manhao 3 str. L 60 TaxID=1049759 RepID=V6HWG9_9LEPT|nr:hypothetical protein LEP1GSC062_0119 [Leptospira alexanderi serovar Manhao 3 str. L 60]